MASASGVEQPQPPTGAGAGAARFLARRPEEKLINDIAVIQVATRKVTVRRPSIPVANVVHRSPPGWLRLRAETHRLLVSHRH
jgi:uncharacterized membrane protein